MELENIKLKKENVYILKRVNHETIKEEVQARTFEYKGHKFNLQGDSKTSYAISDNRTGMLIGAYFFKLKDLKKFKENLDTIIDIEKDNTYIYASAIKDFQNAKIVSK